MEASTTFALSAARLASLSPVAPPIAGFQPLIVPSRVAKIKIDRADTPFSVIVKSVGLVQSGESGAIVADPPGAGGECNATPGVDQMWVSIRRYSRLIRH